MAELYFKIKSDWQEVQKLREELSRLEAASKQTGTTEYNQRMGELRTKITQVAESAAKAAVEIQKQEAPLGRLEQAFRRAYGDAASSSANDLRQSIEIQKTYLADLERAYKDVQVRMRDMPAGANTSGMRNDMAALRTQIDEEKAALDGLARKYNELGSKQSGSGQLTAMSAQIKELTSQMALLDAAGKKETAEYKAKEAELQRLTGEYTKVEQARKKIAQAAIPNDGGKMVSLRTQLMEITNQMAAMDLAGQRNTAQYRQLEAEMERLGTAYRKVSQLRQQLSTGATQTGALLQGVQGLAGAFSMATGVVGLFTKDQEKLAQIQTKLQGIMAVLMGLQQAQVALHSTSAFRLQTVVKLQQWWNNILDVARGKTAAQTAAQVAANAATAQGAVTAGAAAAAQGVQTTAAVAGTAANITLAGAFRAVGAAIASIPVIGWIVTGIAAIAAGVAAWSKEQEKLNKNIDAYNKEILKEQQEIDALFGKLKQAEEGTKGWQRARDAIMSKYGSYLSQLDAEAASLRDIEAAYQGVSKAARQAAQERALASVSEEALDKYVKRLGNARATLMKQVKSKGVFKDDQSQLPDFLDEVTEATTSGGDIGAILKKYKLTAKDLKKSYTTTGSGAVSMTVTDDILKIATGNMQKAKDDYEQATADARAMFATVRESDNAAITQDLAYWQAQKRQYEELRNALTADELNGDKAREYAQKIAEAESKIAKYSAKASTSSAAATSSTATEKAAESAGKALEAVEKENAKTRLSLMQEGREKALAQVEADYADRLRVVQEKEDEMLKVAALTEQQQAALDEARVLAAQQREKSIAAVYQSEAAAMQAYLKEYGTFAQQRQAIEEEYAAKIEAAGTQGERLTLERQRDTALKGVEGKAVTAKIDWYTAFSGLGSILSGALKPLLTQLEAFVRTDEFRGLQASDQQKIVEAIGNIRGQVGSDIGWQELAADMQAYQQAQQKALAAEQAAAKQAKELAPLIAAAKQAIAEGDYSAQDDLDSYYQQQAESAQAVSEANAKVQVSGTKLAQSTQAVREPIDEIHNFLSEAGLGDLQRLWDSFNKLKAGISGLNAIKKASESLVDAAEDTEKLGDATESVAKTMSNGGLIGQIVAAILSILDVLKDGIGALVADILDSILGAISGILKNILSGEFLKQIGESLLTGISGIFDAITFGGWSSWFGDGASFKHLEEYLERLSITNEALADSVDELTEAMSDTTTSLADAKTAYETAVNNIESEEANTQSQMSAAVSAYSNGTLGIGGSHSSAYKINKGMSSSDWAAISEAVGKSVTNASQFFALTSEEMWNAATYAPVAYAKLKDLADNGYADAAQYMDDYIALWQEVEDAQQEYWEKLTDTDFDSIESSFRSLLTDMNSSAADFASDFEELMLNAVVNSLMSDKYSAMLEEWYEDFAEAMEDDGLSTSEKNSLRESYMAIYEAASDELQALIDSLGIDTSLIEDGGTSSWTSMGQDTADELNGRFTALQIAGEEVSVNTATANDTLTAIRLIGEEGRHIMANAYIELQEINERQAKWNTPMLQAFSDLSEIKNSVKKL